MTHETADEIRGRRTQHAAATAWARPAGPGHRRGDRHGREEGAIDPRRRHERQCLRGRGPHLRRRGAAGRAERLRAEPQREGEHSGRVADLHDPRRRSEQLRGQQQSDGRRLRRRSFPDFDGDDDLLALRRGARRSAQGPARHAVRPQHHRRRDRLLHQASRAGVRRGHQHDVCELRSHRSRGRAQRAAQRHDRDALLGPGDRTGRRLLGGSAGAQPRRSERQIRPPAVRLRRRAAPCRRTSRSNTPTSTARPGSSSCSARRAWRTRWRRARRWRPTGSTARNAAISSATRTTTAIPSRATGIRIRT